MAALPGLRIPNLFRILPVIGDNARSVARRAAREAAETALADVRVEQAKVDGERKAVEADLSPCATSRPCSVQPTRRPCATSWRCCSIRQPSCSSSRQRIGGRRWQTSTPSFPHRALKGQNSLPARISRQRLPGKGRHAERQGAADDQGTAHHHRPRTAHCLRWLLAAIACTRATDTEGQDLSWSGTAAASNKKAGIDKSRHENGGTIKCRNLLSETPT